MVVSLVFFNHCYDLFGGMSAGFGDPPRVL